MSKATELAQELMITHKSHSDEGPTAFSEAATEMIRLEEINTELLEALDNLARYADTCELFLRDTHPGKASALRSRVSKAIAAITKAQGEVK